MNPILNALALLEQEDDKHWTTTGLPAMEILKAITGNLELTRKEVTAVAPEFTRVHMVLPVVNVEVDDAPHTDTPAEDAHKLEAQAEAKRLMDKQPVAVVEEEEVPRHILNQRAIQAVIARAQQDRIERGGMSRLDQRLQYANRKARRQK